MTAMGESWKDVKKELFTKEEILATDKKVELICELIEARNEQKITQRQLEELCGVSQPVIARIEKGKTIPNLDTVLKILAGLGKTLAIVPLEEKTRQI